MQRKSEATVRAGCGCLHPGQRLRYPSPSALPAHCAACGLLGHTFSGSQRHTVGSASHTVWANHAESEWKACARQIIQQAGAQARSEWLTRQLVPLVLDRVVQTGRVQVVVVVVVVVAGAE